MIKQFNYIVDAMSLSHFSYLDFTLDCYIICIHTFCDIYWYRERRNIFFIYINILYTFHTSIH